MTPRTDRGSGDPNEGVFLKLPPLVRWLIALTCSVPAFFCGCSAEGEGSIHADRTTSSKFMIIRDRKFSAPSGIKAPTGPASPKLSTPKQ
jgi:hypothetical protein